MSFKHGLTVSKLIEEQRGKDSISLCAGWTSKPKGIFYFFFPLASVSQLDVTNFMKAGIFM